MRLATALEGLHSLWQIEEARAEYGDEIASRLKTDPDNGTILWPQPHQRDGAPDPADPQNWSARRKTICLIVASLAAIVPDVRPLDPARQR